MSSFRFNYNIRARLLGVPETPATLGAKILHTLDTLSRVDPVFDNWHIIDCRAIKGIPLATARPRMTALVEKEVYRDDRGKPHPDEGYTVVAGTKASIDARSAVLSITNAGGERPGESWLELGDVANPPDPAIVTYPLFRDSLLSMNSVWSPRWANAYTFEMGYDKTPLIPGAPLFPYSRFHMSWLAYLSAPLAAGVRLPPEILTERTPDGGLLMIATEERLDPTNSEHLRRSRILAETMIAHSGERSS